LSDVGDLLVLVHGGLSHQRVRFFFGEILRVRLPERQLSGLFKGLDDNGRLLLEQGGRISAITTGEVFGFGEC